MNYAPILLFVYSRLDHTKRTVNSLKKNTLAKNSDLFIFSDAARGEKDSESVQLVRNYIKSISGFKTVTIFESKNNLGLAKSIVDGVTKIVNKYGRVIVLEDDMVTSKYYLKFMNDALNKYENTAEVVCISGYVYPIHGLPNTFFIKGADCWGWATWKRGWKIFENDGNKLLKKIQDLGVEKEFDFGGGYEYTKMLRDSISGKNNSWAIKWYAAAFLNNKLTLYPGKSLVLNIGNDSSGTHKSNTSTFDGPIFSRPVCIDSIDVVENILARSKFEYFFKKRFYIKIIKKITAYFRGAFLALGI